MFWLKCFLILSVSFWPLGGSEETKGGPPKKTSLDLPRNPSDFNSIRILLAKGLSQISVSTRSPYVLTDPVGRTLLNGDGIAGTQIRSGAAGIQFGGQTFGDNPLRIESQGEGIKVDSRLYRETIEIWQEANGKLSLINEILIEDYLKGVLPWEANPKWSSEALMAQAIAARTYALFKAIENRNERFTLSKDVLSQVYGGKSSEKSATSQAVDLTRGQILTFKGKIFPAYFHSTCGGATTRAEYIWKVEPHPSLEGVACNFCRPSKHYRWEATFSAFDIEAKLKKQGFSISGIRDVFLRDKDATGRVREIDIEHSKGKTQFQSNDFRLWLDPGRLKSTLIPSIEREGDRYHFRGRGWGHGVGLCQYGMKELADLGYSHEQILLYYYPGAQITNLNE